MAARLLVGGLSPDTNEDEVRQLFAQLGEVLTCRVVRDRHSNRSRGFAFIEMTSAMEAQQAISRFDGYRLDGQTLTVNEAREKSERNTDRGY